MKRVTFVLTSTKEFRLFTRIFLKGIDNKPEQRNITFTTEHKVSEKERNRNARRIPAEFSTNDGILYDAILRCPAYGKTFVLKDDPKGELKREPFNITPLDAKKIALKNIFEIAGFEFDSKKSSDVLEEEYRILMSAKTGVKIGASNASEIPHIPVNVEQEIQLKVEAARKAYEDKYNEPIPDDYANDKAFLDGMSNPDFDAKAYMDANNNGEAEPTIEDLQKAYFEEFKVNVPNPKKNNAAWIKSKLTGVK